MFGGVCNDAMYGTSGNDLMYGQDGSDAGNDVVSGATGTSASAISDNITYV
jgi:hypothetical protein